MGEREHIGSKIDTYRSGDNISVEKMGGGEIFRSISSYKTISYFGLYYPVDKKRRLLSTPKQTKRHVKTLHTREYLLEKVIDNNENYFNLQFFEKVTRNLNENIHHNWRDVRDSPPQSREFITSSKISGKSERDIIR